jgi:Mrp family chromosome partitioning ATPase
MPLHAIPHGTSSVSPAELLHSSRLDETIQTLAQHFNLVLVDSPPVNLISDTHILADHCDAVLFVARAFVFLELS